MRESDQVPVSLGIEHRSNKVVQDIGVASCAKDVGSAQVSYVRLYAQARSDALGDVRDHAVQIQ